MQGKNHGVYGYKLGCRCDVCREAKSAAMSAYYARNRDALKAKVKERYWADRSAHLVKGRERRRAWAAANRERERARVAAWAAANPEKRREIERRFKASAKGQAANRLQAHRRRGAKSDPESRDYLLVLAGDPCSYCNNSGGTTDHITALVDGGTGHWTNLSSACLSCNSRKQNRRLLSFLASGVAA
jgi:5-methylcytosine-specific restriction endonuclease McrA